MFHPWSVSKIFPKKKSAKFSNNKRFLTMWRSNEAIFFSPQSHDFYPYNNLRLKTLWPCTTCLYNRILMLSIMYLILVQECNEPQWAQLTLKKPIYQPRNVISWLWKVFLYTQELWIAQLSSQLSHEHRSLSQLRRSWNTRALFPFTVSNQRLNHSYSIISQPMLAVSRGGKP